MDQLQAISAFVAVAKARGFSAAGRELGVPLATISRRVAELEAALGVRLLHRSTRKVVLTDQGGAYFAACERVLDQLKEAAENISGEYLAPRGELAITAPVGLGRLHLQPIALDFLAAYPDVRLRLLLVDRLVDLVEERIDLAARIANLRDSSLIAKPIGHIRMVVVASPAYLARRGTPKHPRELTSHASIGWVTLGPLSAWWFREQNRDKTFPIRVRLWTTTAESALDAASAGLGLLQTGSYQAAQGIRDGTLVRVLQEFECAATPMSFVYPSNQLLPAKVRAFIDYAAPRLTERLQGVAATIAPRAP